MAKTYDESHILQSLKTRVKWSSQALQAETLGFTRAFINDVLHERRPITVKLAEALGYSKLPDRYAKKGKASK